MERTPLLISLLFLLGPSLSKGIGYSCVRYISQNDAYYNLENLKTDPKLPYSIESVSLKLNDDKVYQGTLWFNICGTLEVAGKNCDENLDATGYFTYEDTSGADACLALSTNAKPDKSTLWDYEAYSPKPDPDGITVLGNNTNIESTEIYFKNFKMKLLCLDDAKTPQNKIATQEEDGTIIFGFTTKYACGTKPLGPLSDLMKMKWLLALFGIIFGSLLIPYGKRIFKPSMSILAFMISFILIYGFFQLAWQDMDPSFKLWFSLGFGLALALFVAYFIYKVQKTAFVIAGMFLGGLIGMLLYVSLDVFEAGKDNGSNFMLWLMMIGCAILFGVLSWWLHKHVLIVSTAFGGSYLVVRSVGSLIGNYPDEFELAQKVQAGELHGIPKVFWGYLIVMLILTIAGIIYQYMYGKSSSDDEDSEDIEKETEVDVDDQYYREQYTKKRKKKIKAMDEIEDEFNNFN